jgi:hypothetical protein
MAKGFKETGFAERRDTAAKAKLESLRKFGKRSSADVPAEIEPQAAKTATTKARKAGAAKPEQK